MGRRKNRSRSKISQLPPEVRSTVDAMVQDPADFTYNDIREYLASLDVQISKSAIGNYARNLMDSLEALAVSQESIKAMMETAAKVPEVDAVEIINRIAGQKIVQAIINKPDEEWTDVALDTPGFSSCSRRSLRILTTLFKSCSGSTAAEPMRRRQKNANARPRCMRRGPMISTRMRR